MVLCDELTVAPHQKQVSFLGKEVTALNISQIATQQFRVAKEHGETAKSYNKISIVSRRKTLATDTILKKNFQV